MKTYSSVELNAYQDVFDKGYKQALKDIKNMMHKQQNWECNGKIYFRYKVAASIFEGFLKRHGVMIRNDTNNN